MADILALNADEKDISKVVAVVRQLVERFQPSEDIAAAATPTTTQIISGAGLTGGGDLSASRTLAVGAGTGITVNADDVALANMAQGTIKGRASGAGTGAPSDLTGDQAVSVITNGAADASGNITGNRWGILPVVGSDGVMEVGRYIDFHNSDGDTSDYAVRLDTNGGTSGLFINSSQIVTAATGGGLTTLSYAGAVGTGTTYTVTGLGGYKSFMIFLRDVSHNSGSGQSFRVELSGNAGSTWGSPLSPSGGTSYTAANAITGLFFISNIDQTNNQTAVISNIFTVVGSTFTDTSTRGPIDALRFSFSGGNFDNGSIDIYGLK